MSDVQVGPGWWQASDGKWYAPEQHPNYQPPRPAQGPPPGYWQGTDGNWYPPQAGQQLTAREKIRLDKANRKALRPWYKKKRWYALAAILLTIVLIIVLISLGANAVNKIATTRHTVVYSVTGTGTGSDITYDTLQDGTGQNGLSQVTGASLPWTKTITVSGLITILDVSGTVGADGGSVTCRITEDGKQLATNTASGAYATASCSASGS